MRFPPQNSASEIVCATSLLSIGSVSLAVEGWRPRESCPGSQFIELQSEGSEPEIRVSVGWRDRIRSHSEHKAFESGGVWTLFHEDGEVVFDFTSSAIAPYPYKRLCAAKNFDCAKLTLSREILGHRSAVDPLEYPADELLFTNYLAHHALGAEVHGCGMIDPEYGAFLFLGHSGAGKSTTTRLWNSTRDPEILSDDRIILRIHDSELWMYGTPWHGEAKFASPAKAKLKRIFILQHGTHNKMSELPRARAVGEMFARCFPPFHSAQGLGNTLEFLHRVVNLVPCYEFQFLPDDSAVEAALPFHG